MHQALSKTRRPVLARQGLSRPSTRGTLRRAGFACRAGDTIQLATAKIPGDVDLDGFNAMMYQWASTLVHSGQNMPFSLAMKVDSQPTGYSLELLRTPPGGKMGQLEAAGVIEGLVEEVDGVGNVHVVNFSAGPAAADMDAKTALDSLVDVPVIMQNMPNAIRNAVAMNR